MSIKQWQLQSAKARLSELVKNAQHDGPQGISLHGKLAVIVISCKEYDALTNPKMSLVTFMQKSPLVGLELDFQRDQSKTRDTDL